MIDGWDVLPVKDSKVRSDRLHKCYHAWRHKACPAVYRNALCWPIRIPVCVADYIGRSCLLFRDWETTGSEAGLFPIGVDTAIGRHPNDPGCCTACVFEYLPLCMPDFCMTKGSGESWGVYCADTHCGRFGNWDYCACMLYCCLWPCIMANDAMDKLV